MPDERIAFTAHADMSGFQRAIKRMAEELAEQMRKAAPTRREAIRHAFTPFATARTRDAAWMLGALNGTGGPRTRTHHIDTETGEFTLLDNQEDTMDAPNEVKIHVTIDREQVREAARLAAELFITEYASRLVEAVDPNYLDDEPVEDCGRPLRVHVNPERTEWLDEPIPVPRPEPADITEEPPVGSRFVDCHGRVWRRGERGWGIEGLTIGSNFDNPWSTVQQYTPLAALEPAPADVDPDESLGSVVDVTDLYARLVKALADLARVTGERDAYKRAKAENDDRFQIEAHDWRERADKAQAKADRYDALRADVEARHLMQDQPLYDHSDILARDTERAES